MDNYIGEIRMFAGNYAPEGWHLCDGSSLLISDNEALYSLIGLTYGGDNTLFNVPDLRKRVVVGTGATPFNNYQLGKSGGVESVTLTTTAIPAHSHSLNASTLPATTSDPTNNVLAASAPGGTGYPSVKLYTIVPTGEKPDAQLDENAISIEGNSFPHNNMMPSITINFIIATVGIYPH